MTTHNVDINVSANTQQAQKSLGYLQSLMGEFGKQATNRMAALLGAAAVAKMAFDKVSQAISSNIAAAKQVSQMAIKFNIDPRAMHSITMAAKDAGVSVRSLTMAMKQLGQYAGKALSSKELQVNFAQLGIEASKLNEIQAKPSKFLPEIAKALMEIGDENQRSAAGAALLGRQYQQLLPLIEELGASEEARKKFLDNENAMTEEQIAANKEIAQIQNDLSDGFDRMVASAAPLLKWGMEFVNFLAQGLGFIKDMIFETEQARKEREAKGKATVSRQVLRYQQELETRSSEGKLTDEDMAGILAAGGSIAGYVAKQADAMKEYGKHARTADNFERKTLVEKEWHKFHNTDEWKAYNEAYAGMREVGASGKISTALFKTLGLDFPEMSGRDMDVMEGMGLTDPDKTDEEREKILSQPLSGLSDERKAKFRKFLKAKDAMRAVANAGPEDFERIATAGAETANKEAAGNAAKAEEARVKKDLHKYQALRKSQFAVLGQVYDTATDKGYSKSEYASLLASRGEKKEDIALKIKAFENESDRLKREKAIESSERKLASSERKLYAGDPSNKQYKKGLDEAEKAADALQDARDAQVDPLKDLEEQQKVYDDLGVLLEEAQLGASMGEDRSADILRLTAQMETEKIKLNELQVKANELKGAEITAEENLKKAKERVYLEEVKRNDKVQARIDAEEEFENQMKYRLMKAEGKSKLDIESEKLTDEEAKYQKMLEQYRQEYQKAMTNEHTGDKGEPLSDAEKERLEGLTKGLDEQSRKVIEGAFNLGTIESKGQVTDMRRIGGGGLEFGGLAGTAKQHLEVGKQQVKALQEIKGVLSNAGGVSVQKGEGRQEGMPFNEVRISSDGSPLSQ